MSEISLTLQLSVFTQDNISCLHFHGIRKLSGSEGTLNFPRELGMTLFAQVERIMLANRVCQKVVNVEKYVELDDCHLFTVTYNRLQSKKTIK